MLGLFLFTAGQFKHGQTHNTTPIEEEKQEGGSASMNTTYSAPGGIDYLFIYFSNVMTVNPGIQVMFIFVWEM